MFSISTMNGGDYIVLTTYPSLNKPTVTVTDLRSKYYYRQNFASIMDPGVAW